MMIREIRERLGVLRLLSQYVPCRPTDLASACTWLSDLLSELPELELTVPVR